MDRFKWTWIKLLLFSDNKIHSLANNTNQDISHVHSMCETNDSLLWVGAGNTLLK